ncbi:MAG: ribonuclease III [Bacteroidales bacterium]|nr:ribonuclease III [Bacteroidales bacterium]
MTGFFRFLYGLMTSPNRSLLWKLPPILGFLPGRSELYVLAFTHKSTSQTNNDGQFANNERLEFLGDAVLGSVIGEYLYKKYPDQNEGFLTKMRAKMVNGETLGDLALKMTLDQLLENHVTGANSIKHISGDAFEALIGAIYMDKGYRITKRFILRKMVRRYLNLEELEKTETNYKSQLIEWAQQGRMEVCFYTDIEPYDPTKFISYVSIGDRLFASGSGASKKEAEQQAAMETLKEIKP